MAIRYYFHWHNIRYELNKRLDRIYLRIAIKMPSRLRMWVVVDSTNTARRMFPDEKVPDYAGPEGLGYKEIYHGALREK